MDFLGPVPINISSCLNSIHCHVACLQEKKVGQDDTFCCCFVLGKVTTVYKPPELKNKYSPSLKHFYHAPPIPY